MAKGTVTLDEVIIALKNLGGEAKSRDIEDHIMYQQRDGNLPKTYQYGGWDSYRKTINQVLQIHTPSYRKFRGKEIFKKIGAGKFRLLNFEVSKYQAVESGAINTSNQSREISTQEFKQLRQKCEKIGDIGEIFVQKMERQLLMENNLHELAEKVKRISVSNISAGYDILSFDLQGKKKYIEVKTTNSVNDYFYITENEISTAKEFGRV